MQKTLRLACRRLRCALKLSSAEGKDALMDTIPEGYRTEMKVSDVMSKVNFVQGDNDDLQWATKQMLVALNFQIDKKSDDLMNELDKDASGFLVTEEAPDMDFSIVDTDKSGFVSEHEVRVWHIIMLRNEVTNVTI